MEKLRINIDGIECEGFKGQTILDIALENDVHIPTFCFDNRMEIFGSCGICCVEVEGVPKLLRACATEISDGMVIKTDTKKVYQSRKVNLELLLSQHVGDCIAPCITACPAQTDIQSYVALIANGKFEEAIKVIKSKIPLPASIGRVCPHPCEKECRRKLVEDPVSILSLKRFAADIDLHSPEPYLPDIQPRSGKRVVIAGGGPGGLSCAYFLAELGHEVAIYDMMSEMGGMLRYGIPEYRLPKHILDMEIAQLQDMGVSLRNNVKIGRDLTFDSLKNNYDAVVVAVGAWTSTELDCPGLELNGVHGGIHFLRKAVANEPMYIGKKVAVVGGGNTAMDACRTAIRLGADVVYNIYRRTRAEMPAEEIEIIEADEEGVVFKYLTHPIEIIGKNGAVSKIRLQKMQLSEMDASGRRRPVPIEGEEETLDVDSVICAIGQGIDPDGFDGVELSRWQTIVADDNLFTTNIKGVFSIGDCINDGATIAIDAIADAKKAADAIDNYLNGIELEYTAPYRVVRDDLTEADFENRKKEPRSKVSHLSPETRRDNFLEFTETIEACDAQQDAWRCLECGCHDFHECKLIATADDYNVKPDRFRESVSPTSFEDDHPFILRDSNKCILCGLCVRICDEVVGSGALGLVNRGYDTIVKPPFGDMLKDTSCISCGQCISVCPTGALQERHVFTKPFSFETDQAESVCGMCGLGCSMIVHTAGGLIVKAVPNTEIGLNNGLMCGRGRFGINYLNKPERLTYPLIKTDGKLTPVSWNDAFVYTANKMKGFKMLGEKTAVAIGHNYCIEDAGALKNLAAVFDSQLLSFCNRENGLKSVLGFDRSPNSLEEVVGADKIIVFGSLLIKKPAVLNKLRKAVSRGAFVTLITDTPADIGLSCTVIKADNSTDILKQIAKALLDAGCVPKNSDGLEALAQSLRTIKPSGMIESLATDYKNAKKAMMLFALEELSSAAATEIANIAVISGHIGSPRSGIYMLRQLGGSQPIADLGIVNDAKAAKDVKAIMIFGEDVSIPYENYDFIMVQDTHVTETAQHADVVFPMATPPEINGMYANSERRLQWCENTSCPDIVYRTAEIAAEIARQVESTASVIEACELYPDSYIDEAHPSAVLDYTCHGFDDGVAKLQVVENDVLFNLLIPTSHLVKSVEADMPNAK